MEEQICPECEGTGYYTRGPNEYKCSECKGTGSLHDPFQREEYIPERDGSTILERMLKKW